MSLVPQNSLFAMESDIPEYRTYDGVEINAQTIGSLVIPLPEEKNTVVKEWRDTNKGLLAGLVDFSYKNSEFRQVFKHNLQILSDNNIENKSKSSYIFALPSDNNLFIQIAGPVFRVLNLAQKVGDELFCKYFGKDGLTSEDYESLGKGPTFQTVSRFAYYLRYLHVANQNNFEHFTVPATYLIPLEDDQPRTAYNDGNTFIAQACIPEGFVTIRENKSRLANLHQGSFKELLTAIAPAALWDLAPNLLINNDSKLTLSDLEQGCNANPDYFLHKDTKMYSHLVVCGFQGIYNLCDEHKELQNQIQDFAREHVQLPHEEKQKELESILKLNE